MQRNLEMKSAFSTKGLLLLATLAASCGCGSSNSGVEKVVITGTVTYDGTPIPNGEVRFYPIEGTKGAVSGGPIRDGAYTAQGKGGVPVGKHRVEIQGFRAAKGSESLPEGGSAEQYLPAQFNENSTLTAEVTPDTENLDFALTSK
jgi:hypothetical protein